MGKPKIAILYDFDKTLSTTDMQNYSFIPNLGMTPDEFWGATGELSSSQGVERILSYMYTMIAKCKEKKIKLTRKYLNECGKNITFLPGVETWFERINKYGAEHGVEVEHYLVSSGTLEIVEGCKIFKYFKKAYGCEFLYGENGEAIWPKLAINYTQKTQFFFRIAKGALDPSDDAAVNEKSQGLAIPYSNIVYMGDGMTDIACMTLVKKNGGKSIAVYSSKKDYESVKKISDDKRVTFISPTDYTPNGPIEQMFQLIIQSIEVQNKFENKVSSLLKQE